MSKKTNVQVVSNIMNYSDHGALAQVFVLNALASTAEVVLAGGVEAIPENSFISPEAWVSVAREIKDKLDKHFAGLEGA